VTPTISFMSAALPNWTPWSAFHGRMIDRGLMAPALCALLDAERRADMGDCMRRGIAQASTIESQIESLVRRLEAVEERSRCLDERFAALAAADVCSHCGCSLGHQDHDGDQGGDPADSINETAASAAGGSPSDSSETMVPPLDPSASGPLYPALALLKSAPPP